MLNAFCGADSPMVNEFSTNLTPVVNLCFQGKCPISLEKFVTNVPITPIIKADEGVGPIVVGTIWRRLVFKVAMKMKGKAVTTYLEDFQFYFCISWGDETILYMVSHFFEVHGSENNLSILLLEFKNVFNLIDMRKMFHEISVRRSLISF